MIKEKISFSRISLCTFIFMVILATKKHNHFYDGIFYSWFSYADSGRRVVSNSVDKFGLAWSVSPVVMGLTVVAFATGAPELAISLQAAAEGKPDLVLGNILGSNIANILLILGIAGLVRPLKITNRIIKIDVPVVIGASVLLFCAGQGWFSYAH
ncbi:hypothetical protein [Rhodohalobacter sp.]|uniref:sodium:calcium antiporter n=1 Tax=Rhodohalobacter sp. TaxID=1974210 RepID=UPI002ACEDA56|nr:hypothetical protein [Rhodohalobacter sp.]MDZ7756284.1 hypothetical protein [Rhodohalobacter sp.]